MPEEDDINIEGIYWGISIVAIIMTLTTVYEAVTGETGAAGIVIGVLMTSMLWGYHALLCRELWREWRERREEKVEAA